jgi:hypothetical protein
MAKEKESGYAMFLNRLSSAKPIVVRNVISGEVMFYLGGKTYFLGSNQTLNLSALGSLLDLKQAGSVHDLIKNGYLRIES